MICQCVMPSRQSRCQPVEQSVAQITSKAGLRLTGAGTDHQFVAVIDLLQQSGNITVIVLTVGVHKHYDLT